MKRGVKWERAVICEEEPEISVGDHPICALCAAALYRKGFGGSDRSEFPYCLVQFSADETALILARFYMSPPASPGRAD